VAKAAPIDPQVLSKLRLTCLDLPEVREEAAWAGLRWTIRNKNFAQVVQIERGYPPAYAKAAGTAGPACVLTFRTARPTRELARFGRAPFFRPPWFANIVGLVLDAQTDWQEVASLLSESYCVLAPKALRDQVDRGT
jgi:hypothetical protein